MNKTKLTSILAQAKSSKTQAVERTINFAYREAMKKSSDQEVIKLCEECIDAFHHIAMSLKAKQGEGVVQMDNRKVS
jgi:hypothetical protein